MRQVTVRIALSIRSRLAMTTCGTSSPNLLPITTIMAKIEVTSIKMLRIITIPIKVVANSSSMAVAIGRKSLTNDQAIRLLINAPAGKNRNHTPTSC